MKEALAGVRQVGANYEEHQQEVGLDIPVDLVHFEEVSGGRPTRHAQRGSR